VVDGEIVVIQQGRARLEAILRRHQLTGVRKIQHARHQSPVTYVLFDLVQWQGQPLFDQSLRLRRARLEELLRRLEEPSLAFSEGIIGAGREFFQQVTARGHEGVMAKHLTGRYLPGRRTSGWRKIKPHLLIPCVILGYLPGRKGFRGLVVASPHEGRLQYTAVLTSGFSAEVSARLAPLLVQRIRQEPVVPCPERATWVEPEFYCQVRCLERTARGRLRGASFQAMLGEAE
jgi:ATP-dependent DNA ligase